MTRKDINTLPPDLYSRNKTIAYIARKLTSGSKLRMLDVGGYKGELQHFFPKETHCTILDILPKPETRSSTGGQKEVEYIQGDAQKIPFSDSCFDMVVASDMLEHVDKPFRAPVIREMLRVSKNHLIIGVPCKSELLEKAEQYVCDQFQNITGAKHPFLMEHSQYGLPEEAKIEEILQKEGVNYTIIKEGNLMNWYIQQLYAGVQHGEILEDKKYEFYRFFNHHLNELGNLRAPTYRTIFVIAKQGAIPEEEIRQELQEENVWKPERFMEVLQKAFNDLRLVIRERGVGAEQAYAMEERMDHMREEFVAQLALKDQTIKAGDGRLAKARETLQTYRETIEEVRIFLQEKEKTINFLKSILSEKDERIESLEQETKEVQGELRKKEEFIRHLHKESQAKDKELAELRSLVQKHEQTVRGKQEELNSAQAQTAALQDDLNNHKKALREVLSSRAWRLVMIYAAIKTTLWTKPVTIMRKGRDILIHLGPKVFWQRLVRKVKRQPVVQQDAYNRYIENNKPNRKARKDAEKEIATFEYHPVISIIVPSYNVDEKWLRKAIDSVCNQWYKRWELCICDDASTNPKMKEILDEYAKQDLRVKVKYRTQNGAIVKASNGALEMATGAYVGFLDNDDELAPDALYEVVKTLQEQKYDLLYSDEDKLDMEGNRCDPFFKPDWSPDLLLSHNYTCHFSVYRRKIINELGGLREGFDGSQDYDLVLRFTEKTDRIKHIPKILYHWRKIPGSTAEEVNAKPYAFDAAKKALRDAAKRRRIEGRVSDGQWTGSYRLRREIQGEPLVSIIIPFKDKVEVLKPCVESILKNSTWQNYELLLVDNRSELLETQEYLKTLKGNEKIQLLTYDQPFNFAAINNYAVKQAHGEYLILLNNDTEVITPEWIEAMLEHAQRPEVGAVGAKLLFPNDQVQHAGVMVGIGGIANHAFLKSDGQEHGYFGQKNIIKNYSSVTGACMMVRKDLYQKMDGLDAENLGISFNDIDFCLRLREKGLLIVYTPYAQLYHYESLTRGYNVAMKEIQYMQQKYGSLMEKGDPYYNKNLSRERFDFSLKVEDKVQG